MKPTKIKALQDKVIIQVEENEERTSGGVIVPDSAKSKALGRTGIVTSLGRSIKQLRPAEIKEGMEVCFMTRDSQHFTLDRKHYYATDYKNILGRMAKKSNKELAMEYFSLCASMCLSLSLNSLFFLREKQKVQEQSSDVNPVLGHSEKLFNKSHMHSYVISMYFTTPFVMELLIKGLLLMEREYDVSAQNLCKERKHNIKAIFDLELRDSKSKEFVRALYNKCKRKYEDSILKGGDSSLGMKVDSLSQFLEWCNDRLTDLKYEGDLSNIFYPVGILTGERHLLIKRGTTQYLHHFPTALAIHICKEYGVPFLYKDTEIAREDTEFGPDIFISLDDYRTTKIQ